MAGTSAHLRRLAQRFRGEGGATAIEFAVVASAFIVVCLGIVDFGRALQVRNGLDYVAEYGAREVMVNEDCKKTTGCTPKTDNDLKTKITELYNRHVGSGTLTVTISAATVDTGVTYRSVTASTTFRYLTLAITNSAPTLSSQRMVAI